LSRPDLIRQLALETPSKIVLVVLDGVGDLRSAEQPRTPLESASTPNLDTLSAGASLGRLLPAGHGITPGSGPGHLALFGYDPVLPEHDIGRGVLEALGLGLEPGPETIAARANFATADANGKLLDRRAGRIATAECRRLVARMNAALAGAPESAVRVEVHPGEGHRFVLLVMPRDPNVTLSAAIADTDPQRLGVTAKPLTPEDSQEAAARTVALLTPVLEQLQSAIADEPTANTFLLRGFAKLPRLPSFAQLYRLKAGAFAGYPLYRGVASACGMQVIECGKDITDIVTEVARGWSGFDFFFLHVKRTDMAGEDGDFDAKVAAIEAFDRVLPNLLELGPDVLAITADHSTPVPMAAHSWHPVPVLIAANNALRDDACRFTELEALKGTLGTLAAAELMGLLLAHAGKLAKFGA
jgi:2,3-bisphosphoglycerate-independent phosphoglycerate mutase